MHDTYLLTIADYLSGLPLARFSGSCCFIAHATELTREREKAKVMLRRSMVYCVECQMWFRGPTQLDYHMSGKKHERVVQKRDSYRAACLA